MAARRRIAQLETELKIARRAAELLKDAKPPRDRFAAITTMAAEGLQIQTACRMLEVSESGFYAWRSRPPSERAIRHAWLTDLVTEIHIASRQTYGSIRVHAELKLGLGIGVGRHQVELVMRRAGLRGTVGRRKRPRIERPDAIALPHTSTRPREHWWSTSPVPAPGFMNCPGLQGDVEGRIPVGSLTCEAW